MFFFRAEADEDDVYASHFSYLFPYLRFFSGEQY